MHAVAPGRALLRGASETVESRDDPNLFESCRFERVDELCLQQSTGDSTGPEVDIPYHRFGQLLVDHDVGDLQASARLEHAGDFGDG